MVGKQKLTSEDESTYDEESKNKGANSAKVEGACEGESLP